MGGGGVLACTRLRLRRTLGEPAWGQKGCLGVTGRLEGELLVEHNQSDCRDIGNPLRRGRPANRAAEFRGPVNLAWLSGVGRRFTRGGQVRLPGRLSPGAGRTRSGRARAAPVGFRKWARGRGSGRVRYRSRAPSGCGRLRGQWPPGPAAAGRPGGGKASARRPVPRCRCPPPAPAGRGPSSPRGLHSTPSRRVAQSPCAPPLRSAESADGTAAGAGGGARGRAGGRDWRWTGVEAGLEAEL